MARIGTALSLRQVPAEYKGLPIIGRGATSIVYECNGKALTLTRDRLKMSWNQEYLDATVLGDFITEGGTDDRFNQYPVFIMESDIYLPLTPGQRRDVLHMQKEVCKISQRNQSVRNVSPEIKTQNLFSSLEEGYLKQEGKPCRDALRDIIQFSRDYGVIYPDFMQTKNWMQREGQVICVDPALDENLREIFMHKFQKFSVRGCEADIRPPKIQEAPSPF